MCVCPQFEKQDLFFLLKKKICKNYFLSMEPSTSGPFSLLFPFLQEKKSIFYFGENFEDFRNFWYLLI